MNDAKPVHPPGPAAEVCLQRWLQHYGVPCPVCRGNLRGCMQARCPHCGHDFKLGVGLVKDIPLWGWGCLMIIWALCGALGLFGWAMCLVEGGLPGHMGWNDAGTYAFIFYLLSLPMVVVCMANQHRFMRWRPQTQWMLVAISLGLGALAFTILVKS